MTAIYNMEVLMKNNIKNIIFFPVMLLLILLIFLTPAAHASAEDAAAISIGKIDYENFTMQIYNNNNSLVYYSTDQSTWTEVEGAYNTTSKSYTIDISWVSSTSDITLYFKGDTVKTIKSVTLPMRNSSLSVKFDKVEGEFLFEDTEDADTFQWRKTSDYNWNTVNLDEASSSYQAFLDTMEMLRGKGIKLYIRTPQVLGTGMNSVGARPSKEVTVTISARVTAPAVKVNSSKLTINTTTAMEYYNTKSGLWIECDGVTAIEDIAPGVLYQNGAKNVTLMIRRAATTTDTFSLTAYLTIPGQTAAPTIGDSSSEVTYYYMNSKLMLQFNKATTSNAYEYAIIKPDSSIELSSASWRSVTTSKVMTMSKSTAPDGATIYVRRKGIDENTSKSVALKLSSAVNNFTVKY
jgi:hypothetical protein